MRTIRLTALLSIALTMALVMMDTAHAASIAYMKGGDVWRSPDGRHHSKVGATIYADPTFSPPVDPDWGPAPSPR